MEKGGQGWIARGEMGAGVGGEAGEIRKNLGKTLEDAKKSAKSAVWKVKIAGALRKQTTATNIWIAERLAMGHPSHVRNLIKEIL